MKALALLLLVAGCDCSTVTRRSVVSPAEAAKLHANAEVVAIDGTPTRGTIMREGDSYAVVTPSRRLPVTAADRLTMRVTYHEGDVVPGEGQVHVRTSPSMIIGGIIALVGSAGLYVVASYNSSEVGWAGLVTPWAVLGTSALTAGVSLVATGTLRRAYVEPWLAPAAFVAPGGGGASLRVRF